MTAAPERPDTMPADVIRTALADELTTLETAWRRPTCTHLCQPLAHTLRCDLAHLDQT